MQEQHFPIQLFLLQFFVSSAAFPPTSGDSRFAQSHSKKVVGLTPQQLADWNLHVLQCVCVAPLQRPPTSTIHNFLSMCESLFSLANTWHMSSATQCRTANRRNAKGATIKDIQSFARFLFATLPFTSKRFALRVHALFHDS